MHSANLVLLLILLTDGKSNKSSCCVGRLTGEDTRNQGSSKFVKQIELEQERNSPGDNPKELGTSGSNACLSL